MSQLPMGDSLIQYHIRNSLAPSTWMSYSSSWFMWIKFLNRNSLSIADFSEGLALKFLSFLMLENYSWSHINKIICGISFFLKLKNMSSFLSFFSVQQALKGYRKARFRPDNRLPITAELLNELCSCTREVCFSDYEAGMFNTAFSICFFAALRVSELIPANRSDKKGLRMEDVVIGEHSLRIHLSKSKTDQLGKGIWISLAKCPDRVICPMLLMKQYISQRPLGNGFLFLHENGFPLTRFQFVRVEALSKTVG